MFVRFSHSNAPTTGASSGMARPYRSHCPGAVFHLIARTQGHEPRFTEIVRCRITEYVASAIRCSDARLLAYAVMSNHLHLIVQQGEGRLERVMQPLLSRTATLVHRTFGTEGHVFERRYRDYPCLDPQYVRDVIVYSHLNPVRANLVECPADYRWTSHRLYMGEKEIPPCMNGVLASRHALALFAPRETSGLEERRRSYSQYVAWRMERDRHVAEGVELEDATPPPPVVGGDLCWSDTFDPFFRAAPHETEGDRKAPRPSRLELRDIARQVLVEHGAGVRLQRIRSNEKTRQVARLRSLMVRRMSAAGHRGKAIARYLRVSDQCVSNILVRQRRARAVSDT